MNYTLTLEYETSIEYDTIGGVVSDLQGASELDESSTSTVIGEANLNIRESGPFLTIRLEKPAPPDQIKSAGDELANGLVQVGFEDKKENAAEQIELQT
jgi:hypothetical protein